MEFLELHAASGFVEDIEGTIEKTIEAADNLAGQEFTNHARKLKIW